MITINEYNEICTTLSKYINELFDEFIHKKFILRPNPLNGFYKFEGLSKIFTIQLYDTKMAEKYYFIKNNKSYFSIIYGIESYTDENSIKIIKNLWENDGILIQIFKNEQIFLFNLSKQFIKSNSENIKLIEI